MAEYAIEKRLFIPYEEIPERVINSFLSAEDKNFFNHPGIDAKGILRAVLKNIKNISQNTSGPENVQKYAVRLVRPPRRW